MSTNPFRTASIRTRTRPRAARPLRTALWLAATGFAAIALVACGDGGSGSGGEVTLDAPAPDRCDPLDTRLCLFPFPNDFYTVADDTTDTGRRVNLVRESMPTNKDGVHVDPTEWNRNDGFSPGSQIFTFVAGLDLEATGAAPSTDIGRSLEEDAPIVLLDADTGERTPYWAELDASVASDDDRALFVRPAINLHEGHRYVVAFRHLKDASGAEIPAGDAFRAMRDRLNTNVPEFNARRDHFEQVFDDLKKNGVERKDLYLAWDFTVISTRNLTGRIIHMRDDAFAALGDAAPAFTVTNVEQNVDDRLARIVHGTFQVPKYLSGTGAPGSRLLYDAADQPRAEGTFTATFVCVVPHAALAGPGGTAVPARASLYGHGLLGSDDEVDAGNIRDMANEHDFVFCATKWLGMSEDDIANAAAILQDLSLFPTLADRTQQGLLDFLFLGRLMIHPNGFSSDPAFQDAAGASVIDRSALFYDGNSQGGIMGGALVAIATDFTRGVLGVPAMNYSTLLQRSVDWEDYRLLYDPSYPNPIERAFGLGLIQMLWDRGEADGYANHLTGDPLPGTPAHTVLMHVALGDWQVANVAADVEARTIGARVHTPAEVPGHTLDVEPHWGIEPIPSYPWAGSAIVVWDSGTPPAPPVNLPPSQARDPHSDPRSYVVARVQKSEFLKVDGAVVDVCEGQPCMAPPR
ncbi:MAG TPA: hypothetical protein VFD92_04440 [Candidatus Binatia bacterium]|nr:hypothetical protein [Candidatus Binatia bacterium]